MPAGCPSASYYPFPANPTGTFKTALERGTILISYNGGVSNDLTPHGFVLADSTNVPAGGPVTGKMADFLNYVVKEIGKAYGVQYLTLKWVTCPTTVNGLSVSSSSDLCFDQLETGAIDVLWGNWVVPSSYDSQYPRFYSFASSPCNSFVNSLVAWVRGSVKRCYGARLSVRCDSERALLWATITYSQVPNLNLKLWRQRRGVYASFLFEVAHSTLEFSGCFLV